MIMVARCAKAAIVVAGCAKRREQAAALGGQAKAYEQPPPVRA
jgi:hypothetical protein